MRGAFRGFYAFFRLSCAFPQHYDIDGGHNPYEGKEDNFYPHFTICIHIYQYLMRGIKASRIEHKE